jgi:hypothetical protein
MTTPKQCNRCADPLLVYTMSRYNRDILCTQCREDEKDLPSYAAAEEAEIKQVRRGNYNFAGVGLSSDDRARLKVMLDHRRDDAGFIAALNGEPL